MIFRRTYLILTNYYISSCSSANSSKLESSTGSSDSSATKRNKISHIRSIHNYR